MGGYGMFDNPDKEQEQRFCQELDELLNRYSREKGSGTPDFVLGSYLRHCLEAWDQATKMRDEWYRQAGKAELGDDLTRALRRLRQEAPESLCQEIERKVRERLAQGGKP